VSLQCLQLCLFGKSIFFLASPALFSSVYFKAISFGSRQIK